MRFTREECLKRLRNELEKGRAIIGAGSGVGISAKCEEIGGVDLIIIYNSGRFRMSGRSAILGHMPLGDANEILLDMAKEILPITKNIPVIAGVLAHDTFRFMDQFLKQLIELGFSGVQNYPTLGGVRGPWKQELDEGGMTYELEVDMIAKAHELGLLTTPYVYDEDQAIQMAKAGSDVLVAHMGGTTGGTIGFSQKMTLDQAAAKIQNIHDAAKSINDEVLVICHGGPIAEPEDADYIIKHTNGVVGFYGASSMERLPVERAIIDQVKKFKSIKIK